jgi:drug/metabolite transporter (DMT)-like permease
MQMLSAGALLGMVGLATGEAGAVHRDAFGAEPLLAFAFLVVFGSLFAFSAYAWLLKNVRISVVATYAFVNPVVAVALGAAFLGEAVTSTTVVAGTAIIVAVVLIVGVKAPVARVKLRARLATLTS